MNKSILAAAAIAVALSTAASPSSVFAMTVATPFEIATETAGLVQRTAVVCGPFGCGHIWRARRYREWGWGRPWGYADRPACPIGYYFACRRGPLGYGQCACWPYRKW